MATEFKEFKSITFDDGVQRNVVVDWNEDDETKGGRVLNKPTNLSDFNNDSGFLTKTTTSLLNYFSKTESDNKYQPKGNYEASGAANLKVDAHDASGQAHADIRENIQSLSNNKADKTAIPSKVSQLSNDSGYLTSVPSEYVTDTELNAKGYLTEHQDLSSYAKKSAIPTKTSQLSNDSGYLTEVPSEYVTDTELNAKGYLTQHQDLSAYAKTANHYTKTETDAKYQTKGNYETAGAANTALANAKSYTDTKVADVATLEVSSSKPTNTSVDLWINPTSEEFICVPEIKDETISTTDTWSSSKISSEIEAAKGAGGEAVDAYTKAESDSKYQPKGNYLTSIPSEYVTETELAAKNYLTAVPSEYVTDSELTAKGYLTTVPSTYAQTANHYTKTESDNKYQAKGSYLTSVPSEYVTETELSAKGYLTTVPSGYAKTTDHYTKTESDNKYQAKGSYETAGAANTALSSAKSYTDTKVASVSTVDVSTSEPTNASVDLWINPSDEDDIYIPEIDDTTTSNYDTWSSSKINTELNSVKESIADLSGGEIPDYWQSHIDGKISTIKALQDDGGKDCFTFVVMSDIHYPTNSKKSPILAKKIMEDCNIKFAMVLGDVQSRGSHGTKENVLNEWLAIKEMFKPIEKNTLFQKGNHDGSWGNTLNSVTYPYNFTPEELYNRVYAPTYKYQNTVTDQTETGYYIDDTSRKVRYIMLNSHCNEYELNADGSAKYNNMKTFRFTQSQYDLVIEALTSMKPLWSVVVLAHAPIVEAYQEVWGGANSDFKIMRGLLTAYKNKTSYSASWNGTNGYDKVSVNVDFEDANGEFIGYFSGHMHNDYTYKSSDGYGVDIITTRCDGKEENGSLLDERVEGTITEQCFDVFTVNTKTSTIYGTRIGAGSDRIISIGGVVIPTYTITNTLTNCTNSNGSSVIEKNKSYTATISAKSGYQLQSVKVTMGGTDITSTVYSNGVINIASVTGDIVITASAKADTYAITNKLTGCTTSNSASSVAHGSSYTATITANANYEIQSVTVTMGGTNITSSAYNNGVINISSVTGNIVITATAIEVAKYVNLFDKSGSGFSDQTSKFYTNWVPYNANDNGGNGTIYHFKGLAQPSYPNPYKMQFKTSSGSTSAQVYCNQANVQAHVKASYDNSVILIQHDTNSTDYKYVQFEIREAVPSNLIITANQDIVD